MENFRPVNISDNLLPARTMRVARNKDQRGRTFLQILRHRGGLDDPAMNAPRNRRSRGRRRRLPRLLGEDAAARCLLLGVDPPVDDRRRRPFLADDVGRRFTRGAVISSEFASRRDDAVVVNHAAGSGARRALYASAWAVFLPPGLLLEDPSDFLLDARNEGRLGSREVDRKIRREGEKKRR